MPLAAIVDLTPIPTSHKTSQTDILDWILEAHIQAETKLQGINLSKEKATEFRELLQRVSCKPNRISYRSHELSDFLHSNWDEMEVYRLQENPEGINQAKRQQIHRQITHRVFERFFEKRETAPHEIFHVSCTGYASPSAAQAIISKKRWNHQTAVTHLYHMGCYAAIPAIKLASSVVMQQKKVQILHIELCTLHMNPLIHTAEQFVAQSLFADGAAGYCVCTEEEAQKPYLRILTTLEEVIPNSEGLMQWLITEWGFQFTLAKEIPFFIARVLQEYLKRLCQKAMIDPADLENAVFAIHPGGPQILDLTQKSLDLKNEQFTASCEIFRNHGNMSSATLPHIWHAIVHDQRIASNTLIISLAFGPGLTIAGAILQKVS